MAAGRYCNEIRTRSRSSRNAFFMPKIYFFALAEEKLVKMVSSTLLIF